MKKMKPSVKEILDILRFENWSKEELVKEITFRTRMVLSSIQHKLQKDFISKEQAQKELKEVLENKDKYNGKTILELAKENQKLKQREAYGNEINEKRIKQRDAEIRDLKKELENWKHHLEECEMENTELKQKLKTAERSK